MGGLTDRTVTELLMSHQALLEERAELRELVDRLGGSWAEHRAALNEVARILGDSPSSKDRSAR
jgi:hypothetical protein